VAFEQPTDFEGLGGNGPQSTCSSGDIDRP
jgi:hypothetical protein